MKGNADIVIPAVILGLDPEKAGIHFLAETLGPRLRGDDNTQACFLMKSMTMAPGSRCT